MDSNDMDFVAGLVFYCRRPGRAKAGRIRRCADG